MADRVTDTPIRVMVVEDSMTSLELLLNAFAQEPGIEVAGVAKNGREAIGQVASIGPDIILMDINMPILNGYEAAKMIMEEHPVPIILMTATWSLDEVRPILESMRLGVLGVYEKPPGLGHPKYRMMLDDIIAALYTMSEVKVVRRWGREDGGGREPVVPKPQLRHRYRIIAIGASTGGPPVLQTILRALPADYPLPIVIAQHMSGEFIDTFIGWLDEMCALKVKTAEAGEALRAGYVYIAPERHHILVERNRIRLLEAAPGDLYVPSVSRLFSSLALSAPQESVALILSGMGSDGAEAITQLRQRGALTVAQSEPSSVVFGMAKEAIRLGGVEVALSPDEIVRFLLDLGISTKERT